MAAPKWVIAMGACASSGGMYRSYATWQGVDRIAPGLRLYQRLSAAAQALLDALMKLQAKVRREPALKEQFSAA